MKTVKFYYSKPVHVRTAQIVTDAQGEPILNYDEEGNLLYLYNCKSTSIVRTLPRITVASVYDPDKNKMYFGVAVCSPKDTFKKSVGRELAEDRARNKPAFIVGGIKRGCVKNVSRRYANQLIADYLNKDVCFDF